MRRQRGFQREAPQQRLAEGVNGADAHAAGQVQHLGEQRAGAGADFVRRGDVQCVQFGVQRRVVQRDPVAEGSLQPQRHFGRGGFGEGQALDSLRLGAVQHQAQQAVGQQLGLARSGGGADKSRDGRVGGRKLVGVGAITGGGHRTRLIERGGTMLHLHAPILCL